MSMHVVLGYPLAEGLKARIAALDPRIEIHDISGPFQKALGWTETVQAGTGEQDLLQSRLREAEILLFPRPPKRLPPAAPKASQLLSGSEGLRWVHYVGAGLNHFEEMGLWDLAATLTNSSGVAAIPIAEHVLYLMLMLARKAMTNFAHKAVRRWEKIRSVELRGKTLGILGFGRIGQECARLAKALGMRIVVTKRVIVTEAGGELPNVDKVYPRADLLEMLAECDFVVLALPLTPETRGIIGAAQLRAMKATACLINIARGRLIEEPALVQALEEGWIAGAGLDVFSQEPLPVAHRFWELPNVIVTCHDSNFTGMADRRITELFCDNLSRYLNHQPLLNVVDRQKGY